MTARSSAPAPVLPVLLTHPAGRVAALVATACVLLSVTYLLYEPDFWEHLLVGRVIWQTHHVPTTEMWTWPTYGAPALPWSWGFRALLQPFWAAGGMWGLFTWRWLVALVTFGVAGVVARRMGARGLSVLVALVACAMAWRARSQIRPETLVSVLLVLELWMLEARRHGGRDRVWLLAPLLWVWANAHNSYLFGLAIAGIYFIDGLITRRRAPSPWPLAAATAAGLALAFLNPAGVRALWQPFDFFLHGRHEPIYATIGELEPLRFREHLRDALPLIVIGWPLLLIRRARRRGIDVAESLMAVVFLALALGAVRFVGMLAVVSAPFLARDLDDWVRSLPAPVWLAPPAARATVASAACAGLTLLACSDMHFGVGVEWKYFPVRACDWIAAHGVGGHGYNTFSLGGYQLWRFWPDRRRLPFMDVHQAGTPRIRELYTFSLEREEYWRELDRAFDFDYALLSRVTFASNRLVDFIESDSSWALVFQDDAAMLFVRRHGPLAGLADSFAYHVTPAGNTRLAALGPALARDAELRARFRTELQRTVRESPWCSQAHEMLANVALLEGRIGDARGELEEAVRIDPYEPALRQRLAELHGR